MRKIHSIFFVFVLSFCVYTLNLKAQDPDLTDLNNLTNVVPPSPTAASLGKYGDIPVGHYTGIPSISIPLHQIAGRQLSVPISLSYHASGIKVDEVASWVGLGWSLNAGGVISRTMRGHADEITLPGQIGYWYNVDLIPEYGSGISFTDVDFLIQASQGLKDLQPDVFNFNFNGYSGKFSIDKDGKAVITPQQKLDIQYTTNSSGLNSFTIRTPDGNTYLFDKIEITTTESSGGDMSTYNSSWYLSKITAPFGLEEITFHYYTDPAVLTETMQKSVFKTNPILGQCGIGPNGQTNITIVRTQTQRLTSISSSAGFSAEFIATQDREDISISGKKLEAVKFYHGTTLIKEFELTQSYFEATLDGEGMVSSIANWRRKRLKLNSVTEKNGVGEAKPPHVFDYNNNSLPIIYSNKQDHWGFYNGQVNGDDMLPELDMGAQGFYPGANREVDPTPDLQYAKAGILTKITYPTGGHTDFDYEGHEIGFDNGPIYNPVTYTEGTAVAAWNDNYTIDTDAQEFELEELEYVTLTYSIDNEDINGSTPPTEPVQAFIKIDKIDAAGNFIANILQRGFDPTNMSTQVETVTLTAGHYRITAEAYEYNDRAWAGITWEEVIPGLNDYQPIKVGGLRIKQISSVAGGGSPPVVKTYDYTTEYDGNTLSSGVLFQKYKYYSYRLVYYHPIAMGSGAFGDPTGTGSFQQSITLSCAVLERYSNNTISSSLTHGSHVGYKEVKELHGAVGENGGTKYKFTNYGDTFTAVYPFPPVTSNDHQRGLLKEKTIYRAGSGSTLLGTPVQSVIYEYNYENPINIMGYVIVRKPNLSDQTADADDVVTDYQIEPFSFRSHWVKLSNETTYTYDESGANPVTTVKTYSYDNIDHLQPTSISLSVLGATGNTTETYETRVQYPADYGCSLADIEAGLCSDATTSPDAHAQAILDMKNLYFMHAVPIEVQKYRDGSLIAGSVNLFKNFGIGGIQLHQVYALETDAPLTATNSTIGIYGGTYSSFYFNNTAYQLKATLDYNSYGLMSTYERPEAGHKTLYTWYDSYGLIASKQIQPYDYSDCPELQASSGLTTTFNYDFVYRNLTTITDPNGVSKGFSYDNFGRLTGASHNGQTTQGIEYHYGGQSGATYSNMNYIATTQYGSMNVDGTDTATELTTITYFDGLGREIQQVAKNQSPDGLDMVVPMAYDAFGRMPKAYLPFEIDQATNSGHFVSNAFTEQTAYYNDPTDNIPDTNNPYTEYTFEASPLNRVLEQAAPGDDWAMSTGRTIMKRYGTHTTVNNLVYNLVETEDEHGNITKEFIDALGRTIATKTFGVTAVVNVGYFYDKFGNLAQVATPAGTYDYLYDKRQRLIAKTIPSKEVEYYIYDQLDRLVMQQDGNLRENREWHYTKYDAIDRPIETGIHRNPTQSNTDIQDWYDTAVYNDFSVAPDENTNMMTYSIWDGNSTLNQISRTEVKILDPEDLLDVYWLNTDITYDDRYRVVNTNGNNHLGGTDVIYNTYNDFDQLEHSILDHETPNFDFTLNKELSYAANNPSQILSIVNNGTTDAEHTYNALGQLTQKHLHKLSTTGHLQTVDYAYNIRGWLTDINNTSDLLGNNDLFAMQLKYQDGTYAQYNGNIAELSWVSSSAAATTHGYNFTYDGLNRLTGAYSYDGNYDTRYGYDGAGNLSSLYREGVVSFASDGTPNYGVIDDLRYFTGNNQVLAIDDETTDVVDEAINDFKDGADFSATNNPEYDYDYNGNMITDLNKEIEVEYNHLNLPNKVIFGKNKAINWIYAADGTKLQKRSCEDVVIDNIDKFLSIEKDTVGIIDKHTYLSFRLKDVKTVEEGTPTELEFYGKAKTKIIDALTVNWTAGDTTGRGKSKDRPVTMTICSVHDYIGLIEYHDGVQEACHIEEGRINLQTGKHEYSIRDHLGNPRVYFAVNDANTADVLQEAHYYPFGLPIHNLSYSNELPTNNYQYNGKELNPDFGLHWNDYGARWYDAQIGKWLAVDPLAAEYPSVSPYVYVLNNPINAIDPDGRRVFFVGGAGNDNSGWNYIRRWRNAFSNAGINDFVRVNASHGKWGDVGFTSNYRSSGTYYESNFRKDPGGGTYREYTGRELPVNNRMINTTAQQYLDNLAANPLGEGEQFNLAGYSYGSVLQAQVALKLANEGTTIDNLVLIGSPIADDSKLFKQLSGNENIKNIIRIDIEGDKLSNPSSLMEYIQGAIQNSGDDGPHFDLARPGQEANQAIQNAVDKIKEGGVKN